MLLKSLRVLLIVCGIVITIVILNGCLNWVLIRIVPLL